jgi:hypothetical protein
MLMTWRKYGTVATIHGVPLITGAAQDFQANPTLEAGDAKISKDGGAFANLATLPDVLPAAGKAVRVRLSAAELTCKMAVIQLVDQTSPKEWEDQCLIVETGGHPSAEHPDVDWAVGPSVPPMTG